MNSLLIAILAITTAANYVNCVKFTDCGSVDGKVTDISVKDCSSSDTACVLKVGTDSNVDIKFNSISDVDSKTATVKFWGILGGVTVPFDITPDDACGNWGVKCPISSGSNNELKIALPVKSEYPKVAVEVRVALVDDNNKYLICQQFPAKIQ